MLVSRPTARLTASRSNSRNLCSRVGERRIVVVVVMQMPIEPSVQCSVSKAEALARLQFLDTLVDRAGAWHHVAVEIVEDGLMAETASYRRMRGNAVGGRTEDELSRSDWHNTWCECPTGRPRAMRCRFRDRQLQGNRVPKFPADNRCRYAGKRPPASQRNLAQRQIWPIPSSASGENRELQPPMLRFDGWLSGTIPGSHAIAHAACGRRIDREQRSTPGPAQPWRSGSLEPLQRPAGNLPIRKFRSCRSCVTHVANANVSRVSLNRIL